MNEIYIMGRHRWRLNEIMARYLIRPIDLANEMDTTNQSISQLKNRLDMPRIDGDRMVSLCDGLNKLIRKSGESSVTITPADLIDYRFEDDAA